MKNKIFQSRDLCLRALDTNSTCAKSVRRNERKILKKQQDGRKKIRDRRKKIRDRRKRERRELFRETEILHRAGMPQSRKRLQQVKVLHPRKVLQLTGVPQSRKRLSEMLLRSKNRAARLQLQNVPTLASAAAVSICSCPTRNSSLQRSIR